MPSFSRESGTAARDSNRDGVPDHRQAAARPADEPTTQPIRYGRDDTRHDLPPVPPETTTGATRDRTTPPPAAPGRRPRASLLATLSLIIGVVAALFVLSGPLAGYGIGLGGLAVLLALGGVFATRRRHVAGKSDALLGLILGLGAVVVGILVLTDALPWLGTDTDTVGRVRQWLDAQFVNRF